MITIKTSTDLIVLIAFKEDDNTPSTGLTPALTMLQASDSAVVIDAQNMTEMSLGMYKATIPNTDIDANDGYGIYVDGGATLTTHRYQYGAFYGNFGNEDTIPTIDGKVDTIDTNVDSILVDTGTTIPATITTLQTGVSSLVSASVGSIYVEYKQTTTTGSVLKGVQVWLTTVSTKTPYATNPASTNDNGLIWWYLKAGTYYVWTAGQSTYTGTITVVSDGTYTFTQNSEVQ